MSCQTCGENAPKGGARGCGPYRRGEAIATLEALKRREPWCLDGACCIMLSERNEADRVLQALLAAGLVVVLATGELALLDGSGKCMQVFATVEGLVAALAGAGGAPNFNALVRDPRYSPTDIESIAANYSYEPIDIAQPLVNLAFLGDWYRLDLGAVGVSHRFCLLELEISGVNALGIETPIDPHKYGGVAVGGLVLGCGTGAVGGGQPGSWVLCHEQPTDWNYDEVVVTDYRCRCENLCTDVPADSADIIYVNLPPALVAGFIGLHVTGKVSRCRWLCPAYPTGRVSPQGNRVPYVGFPVLRPVPGNIPFLSP